MKKCKKCGKEMKKTPFGIHWCPNCERPWKKHLKPTSIEPTSDCNMECKTSFDREVQT